jgi:hypothetical protein
MSAAKQAGGKGKIEKCKQRAAQKKRTHTTWKSTQTQPLLLAVDYFAAALECMLDDDWCRTWAAGRTIMLRRTSKRVKEVVDKMRLPAVVRLSRRFWDDARNGTAAQKLQFVLRQLAAMTAQCPALAYLDLCSKKIEAGGAERLGGVLAQRWLISISATIRLTSRDRKAWQCWGSAQRWRNSISATIRSKQLGKEVLQVCWRSAQRWLTSISATIILEQAGQRVLQECLRSAQRWLTSISAIFRSDQPGQRGLQEFLRSAQRWNDIGTVGKGRLRASWRGQASVLVL